MTGRVENPPSAKRSGVYGGGSENPPPAKSVEDIFHVGYPNQAFSNISYYTPSTRSTTTYTSASTLIGAKNE